MINFTKIIIPFKTKFSYFKDGLNVKVKYFKESNGEKIEKVKDKWLPFDINTQYLLENVANKITNTSNPAQIGKSFVLNNEIRHRFGFPQKDKATFYSRNSTSGIDITFGQVCMHFFETNIGFCEIEFSIDSDNVSDYINANYFLSELKSLKNVIKYTEKKKEGLEEKVITMSEIVDNIFLDMEGVESFEKEGKMTFVNKKPLIYGYCLVKDKKTLLNNIDIAKHNYKSTYKVSSNVENYSFFDNSVIGASDLGVINMSCLTDDEETNSFFKTTYLNNLKDQYYYLYLLLLNEKYTLTKRLSQYSLLCNKKNITSRTACEEAKSELNTMINKNILTKVRCDDSVVSLTPQIQGYFDYLKRTFEIEKLLNLVEKNNEQLSEMMQVYINHLDEIRNKELQKKENKLELNKLYLEIFIFVITNIVGTLTIFSTILDVMEKFNPDLINTWFIAIPIVCCVAFALVITLQIISKIKSVKLIKEKMGEDK